MHRSWRLAIPVLCLGALSAATQSATAVQEGPGFYDLLIGSWEGELEYLDYGDDRTLVRLPTSLVVQREDATTLTLEYSFEEPDGSIVESRERLRKTPKGIFFGALWQIEEQSSDGSGRAHRLVMTRDAEDNGRPATIRTAIVADENELTITKLVQYEEAEEYLQRNQYRFRREAAEVAASELVGVWTVDLRPTPDAAPYLQEFVVESVAGDSIVGMFYGTAIEEGRINRDWGALRFAFVTADGSGPYNHSGMLTSEGLVGMTHSLGRDFLAYWTAVRAIR